MLYLICFSIPLNLVSLHLSLTLSLSFSSPLLPLNFFSSHSHSLLLFISSFSSISILHSLYTLLVLSVPNLNSDLFDLQPAFIPAVQSTPSISTANSAWGGRLPTYTPAFCIYEGHHICQAIHLLFLTETIQAPTIIPSVSLETNVAWPSWCLMYRKKFWGSYFQCNNNSSNHLTIFNDSAQ